MKKHFIVCLLIFTTLTAFSQDIITTKLGEDIKAKVLEVNPSDVKFKKMDNIDGPIFSMLKTDILIIRYENGTKDIFSNNIPATETSLSVQDPDAFEKGKADAIKFYTGKNSGAGGTGITSVLISPLFGLIPAIACSSTEPNSDNLNFPNHDLMKNNEYMISYKNEARKIKKEKVWGGYAIGSSIWVGLFFIMKGLNH